jgi:four helix bundle protein
MEHTGWTPREKPYDLRERLLLFACLIVRLTQFLHTCGPIATALSYQMLKSGVSAGANYEEADDGSSAADTRAKRRIVFRELKETAFRIRVLRRMEYLTKVHDPVLEETGELIRIVAKLIRNSSS